MPARITTASIEMTSEKCLGQKVNMATWKLTPDECPSWLSRHLASEAQMLLSGDGSVYARGGRQHCTLLTHLRHCGQLVWKEQCRSDRGTREAIQEQPPGQRVTQPTGLGNRWPASMTRPGLGPPRGRVEDREAYSCLAPKGGGPTQGMG